MTGQDVVTQARTWLGTPYHHQGRIKGVGVDCLGVVVGVARELDLADSDVTDYPYLCSAEDLFAGLDARLDRVDLAQAAPGDVLVLRPYWVPRHVAILTGPSLIHVHEAAGRVVEVTYDDHWRGRTVRAYRFRGVRA